MVKLNTATRMMDLQTINKNRVIVLLGATASGKSEIIQKLSDYLPIELISADSVQIYRRLDIGSAKPSKEEMKKFPHHLIDIKQFDEVYSAGEFVSSANALVEQIKSRSNIPVISGGTNFYIKNFLYGMSQTPPTDSVIREKILNEKERLGLVELYKRLQKADPQYANKISEFDSQRITRALEIIEITGKGVSSFSIPSVVRDDLDIHIYAIKTDSTILKARIVDRVDKMFSIGLEREVSCLINDGANEGMQSMKAIGYREFFIPELSIDEIKERIISDTVHYAKRQRTFMRSIPMVAERTHDEILNTILNDFT